MGEGYLKQKKNWNVSVCMKYSCFIFLSVYEVHESQEVKSHWSLPQNGCWQWWSSSSRWLHWWHLKNKWVEINISHIIPSSVILSFFEIIFIIIMTSISCTQQWSLLAGVYTHKLHTLPQEGSIVTLHSWRITQMYRRAGLLVSSSSQTVRSQLPNYIHIYSLPGEHELLQERRQVQIVCAWPGIQTWVISFVRWVSFFKHTIHFSFSSVLLSEDYCT